MLTGALARERARADARAEREAEREHQRAMLETIFTKMVEFSTENSKPIRELAEAQKAQAEVLMTWLKGFQVPPEPTPSVTVREEDEFLAELQRTGTIPTDKIPVGLPPELQLAWVLKQIESDGEPVE